MVHDRTYEGQPHVFGNMVALYRGALTWHDHATGSVWSQVLGRAIIGPMKGAQLDQIPSSLHTWSAWRNDNPETLVLEDGAFRIGEFSTPLAEGPKYKFVVGVRLANRASAYYVDEVRRLGVINDRVGKLPIVVVGDDEHRIGVFSRNVGREVLEFESISGSLFDRQTGTRWDPRTGLAVEGALSGKILRIVPHMSSFDWAWKDFYPESRYVPNYRLEE